MNTQVQLRNTRIKSLAKSAASVSVLLMLGLLAAAPVTANATGNTGSGGVITYTDSNGSNAVVSPPYVGGYVVHTFKNSDTLNIPVGVSASVLVVAGGGGGGGANGGGGGGAGGMIYTNGFAISAGSATVTVGAGGAVSANGSNSVFGTLTAIGGGYGESRDAITAAPTGGSGGGGAAADQTIELTGGNGTAGQGNNGGAGITGSGAYGAGGGGGAGASGSPGSSTAGGAGGVGLSCAISGTATYYAGGGGGAQQGVVGGGAGGNGGGAAANAGAGAANTGGGGGGGSAGGSSGAGGSGIVIVRYPFAGLAVSVTAPANGQSFPVGSSITATVAVVNGASPYTVAFYTNSASAWSTNSAATNTFTINLGTLDPGTYTNYATVSDNVSSNDVSATNTFSVLPLPGSFFWTNTVSGGWSVAGNWTNLAGYVWALGAAGEADYTLNFNKASTYTATNNLNNGFLLNQLNFGGATVTLAGNSLALTNNGATLPQVNQNSAAGVTVNNNLVLAANITLGGTGGGALTLGGSLSGAGSLTKTNSNTLTLSGANSYSGGTTINAGVLIINSTTALGNTSTITVNNGGEIRFASGADGGTISAPITLNGTGVDGGALYTYVEGSQLTFNGAITLGSSSTIYAYAGTSTLTFNGAIGSSGVYDLTFSAGGAAQAHNDMFVLQAASSPSWTGNTIITSPGGANATVKLQGAALPSTTVLTLKDGNASSLHNDAVFDLNGNNQALAGLTDVAAGGGGGRFVVNTSGTLSTLTINNSASYTFTGVIGVNSAGAAHSQTPGAGNIALTKTGAGALALSSTNTYTGATSVNNGTLLVNSPGSLPAGSAVTVASGATLGGNGTISGPVSVAAGGNLSPGASAGTIGMLSLTNTLTLNGANLYFDLISTNTPGTSYDQIANTGSLVLNGANTIYLTGGTTGTYWLVTCPGIPSGSGSVVFTNGTSTMNGAALSVVNGGILLTLTNNNNVSAIWKGSASSTTWDNGALNWTRNGVVSNAFVAGDDVTFDNSAANFTVTSVGTVQPASVTVSNTTSDYTISATIGGPASLLKMGSAQLILGSTANTFNGKTTLSGGTVQVSTLSNAGVAGPLGAPTGANAAIDLYNNTTFYVYGGGIITTDRGFNLAGAGSGTVTIKQLSNGTTTTLGGVTATGTGAKTLSIINGTGGVPGGDRQTLILGAISDGTGTISLQTSFNTQSPAYYSYINLPQGGTFTGSITTLNPNNRFGYLTIGGTLYCGGGSGVGYSNTPGSGTLGGGNYAGAISLAGNTYLCYDSSATQALSGAISGAGNLQISGTGALTLSATNTYTGTTTINAGALSVGGAGQLGSGSYANTITTTATATFNYNSTAPQTLSGGISGAGALVKNNTGTLNLTGANSYTGATTVSNGTLLVSGSLSGSSLVTVMSGGTLGGTGTVGVVTNNGILSPGYGAVMGTLTTSNLVLNAGCTNVFDLSGTNVSDSVAVNGNLAINGIPVVVVNMNSVVYTNYPLLVVSGTATNTVPTLNFVSSKSGVTSKLSWGGTGRKDAVFDPFG